MSYFYPIKTAADFLQLPSPLFSFEPTWHKVAQSFPVWPVVLHDNGLQIRLFEWGLIADYMSSPELIAKYRTSMANARSEKIVDDPRSAWYRLRQKRCLVLTTGFFEHREVGAKKKLPYFIRESGQELGLLAGLYNYSPIPDPDTGELIGTFAVVTRPANSLLGQIHNSGPNSGRMPLLLPKDLALDWLSPQLTDAAMRQILAYERPASCLQAWPVHTIRVPKDDTEAVIRPIEIPAAWEIPGS